MNNAKKFKKVFGIYASELWAKSGDDFIEWLKTPATDTDKVIRCKDCKYYRPIVPVRIGEKHTELKHGCIHASVEVIKVFPDHYCSFGVRNYLEE